MKRVVPCPKKMALSTIALVFLTPSVRALDLSTADSDIKVHWDNTFKYSAASRLKSAQDGLINSSNPNLDDGDRAFSRGLISNRVDLLSELDVSRGGVGFRVSGAGWYDSVYNTQNDNSSGFSNALSVPSNEFTKGTRDLHGRKAELLDAFVFGKTDFDDMTLSARLGRHTLLWGESLFFGSNGIAAGQAPVDIVKLLSVPNTQFKELIRPTNQLSTQLQLSPTVSLGAYVQFEWERNRVPGSGSYFSRADIFDKGGEQFLLPPFLGGPVGRSGDIEAKNSGQGGLQLRWRAESVDTDFGFYAIRYNDKDFQVQLHPGQNYQLLFHEGVRAFGTSFSKSVGSWNLAGEVSVRRNAALVATGGLVVDPTGTGNNSSNPLYPVGNSGHLQFSAIHTLERSDFWDGGLFLGEIAWHRRTSVTKNAAALDPNATRDASALRFIFQPTYYQFTSGLDLSVPVGVGFNLSGRSSVIPVWNGSGGKGNGDFSIGLMADYLQTWKASVNYTRYIGSGGPILDDHSNYSFKQSLKDRDFLSISIQRTF